MKMEKPNWGNITYLENESTVLNVQGRDVKAYGNPMTPKYGNWAFQYKPTTDVWKNAIPVNTNILITHGTTKGHLYTALSKPSYSQDCPHLQRKISHVKPRLHICGHIHAARGVEHTDWGWLRWGYYSMCRGEGGLGIMLRIMLVRVWMWILYACGIKRQSRMTSVNAAVTGE
jgi:hypothetical protein